MAAGLALAFLVGGCKRDEERLSARGPAAAVQPEFIDESFDQLYPMFLLHKLDKGPKALLWRRYEGKWVRWTGKLVSFTANGTTFKHVPATATFDVSLHVDPSARGRFHSYKPGDEITYTGQLHGFDDIFRTFYLVHGDVEPR